MKLIVGLGNPGKEYKGTRHNVGFEVLDRLAKKLEVRWTKDAKRHASVGAATIDGEKVVLAKPSTFMNESGRAVQALVSFYKLTPHDLLIVQDEMDLAPGRLKLVPKGGPAGHKGVSDIQEKLGTKDFSRLRIGIGHPTGPADAKLWVLTKPSTDEETIEETLARASQAALDWIIFHTPTA
ncbi:aminoacyl-tRNA hydrolase [Candidatus Uhrbacteria bacterium]|nr:aminoacyl-tRNA hydrolase [Candidatus Uhrbacteria bacterium]